MPFGHWKTQTFIAGLRCHGPPDRAGFDAYVETKLAPTLQAGDVVILDNSKIHKSMAAEKSLKEHGAWFLFLPAYSPDLNLTEMAFSKLRAHLRNAGVRTYDALWRAVGDICGLFFEPPRMLELL